MPLSKKEIRYLEGLQVKLLDATERLHDMADKHQQRVERSRKKDKDFSLSITLDDAKDNIEEALAELSDALTEYADR